MEREISTVLPSPLESVQYQFQTWRETKRRPREPIPEDLWAAAAKLKDQYPISQISRSLRLNHTDLKNRILGNPKKMPDQVPSPVFVELNCLQPFSSSECIIEMEERCGSKMKMTFKGQASVDLLELGKAFWKKGK